MRVVTILGPSQSGKTTLAAGLAALEDTRPKRMTFHGEAAATRFAFMGDPWTILDIPGGAQSMALIGPALLASDAAVLCLPAEVDAAVLAAPYLPILEAAALPTFLFLNKVDAASDRIADVVAALQAYCGHAIILRQIPIMEGRRIAGVVDLISERAWAYAEGQRSSLIAIPEAERPVEEAARADLLDHLADFDDRLLEELIEDRKPLAGEVYDVATKVLQHHDLIPALLGAAGHGNGLMRLMKSLRHEVPEVDALRDRPGMAGVLAAGAAADQVKHLGKTVLIRALAEPLAAGARIAGGAIGSLVDLDGRTPVASLAPGEIAVTVKTDHLGLAAPLYRRDGAMEGPDWARPRPPAFRSLIAPVSDRDDARLAAALARLGEIDPGLAESPDPKTGKTVLATQGPLHLRRLVDRLDEVFGVKVTLAPVPPALCETIARPVEAHYRHRKQTGGAGQFADVLIAVAPLARGEGFRFAEEVKGGAVPRNYIPAVEAGARDALAEGPHGLPVVDLAVVLKDGKHHAVDSSDFAFRTAGKAALREALAEAGTRVLQPIRRVTVRVPGVYSGALVPLVSGLHGQVLGFRADPEARGWDLFEALMPEAAESEFFQALGGATRGTAWHVSALDRYDELREDQKIPGAG
jgi:elongation factor G